jgi:ADP-heptose:LPS heptosyltransferase
MEGVAKVVAKGASLPAFDYQCPILSLPLAFKTNMDTIPASHNYVRADPGKVSEWQARLGEKQKPRLGLVWSGNTNHKNDHNRSIALVDLVRLLSPDYQFISLQKEVRHTDNEVLQAHKQLLHLGEELRDFSDTAALCELMDIVISVDTSIAHLAGALGKEVWILLPFSPDWRWLLDRDDSVWYPTARLYRQTTIGNWASVIDRLTGDLKQRFDMR